MYSLRRVYQPYGRTRCLDSRPLERCVVPRQGLARIDLGLLFEYQGPVFLRLVHSVLGHDPMASGP